jgi:hypothetical protein
VRSSGTRGLVSIWTLVLCLTAGSVAAQATKEAEGTAGEVATPWRRPPVSLRGGYTLDRGEVVLTYRFERLSHDDLQSSRTHVSPEALVPTPYQAAPRDLDLDRHVFGALWSPVEQLTFQLELPFVRSRADQVYDPGTGLQRFDTVSSGFGDVMLWVLYRVYRDAHSDLHLNLGLSFPSGSIGESQPPPDASADELERLSYPLQLGSGTVDLQPGFTYSGRYQAVGWGLQGLAVLRAGTNEFDYILGNAYEFSAWSGYAWSEWLSSSFLLRWRQRFEASGADPAIDPTWSPMADLENHALQRLDAVFGVAIAPTGGPLDRTRWVLDVGLPAYQKLEGVQPRARWLLQFALEVAI